LAFDFFTSGVAVHVNIHPSLSVATFPSLVADVDIGIIYGHERQWMPRLLSTLGESGRGLRMHVVLVDNDSPDGAEQWRHLFPQVTLLYNNRPLTYSENLNRILQASRSRYVLLLNTDMYFDPQQQCVAKMVQFMETHPDCGIAGCRLYHEDGEHAPSARRFQTLRLILARRFGLGKLLRRTIEEYFYQDHAIDESWACDWLSGCFLMVRRAAIDEVGHFDTGFGKYFEDVDMCLRMARAGWRVMYNGGTYCYHLEQRDSTRLLSIDARRHALAYLHWLLKWGFAPQHALPDQQQPFRRAA
jgi:N-acetylglucosaminyl-diphospho-decaprenol L-rhamnosyltransferase